MGGYAFCCSFQPGSPDESPLIAALTTILGQPPSMGAMANLRRLFYECHTVALVDMRSRTERGDEDTPKKLQLPERVARMAQLRARYPGLLISGELEFSYALMDRVVDQFDRNEVKYIELYDCTRRDKELDGVKKDDSLRIDITPGAPLKISSTANNQVARLGSDLEIRNAFVRRALAYDAAGLLTYSNMEQWIVKLFRLMQQPAVEDHSPISLNQAFRADKRLWALMADETRANIIPIPGQAKPLDQALRNLMDNVEVTFLLLPLPLWKGSSQSSTQEIPLILPQQPRAEKPQRTPYDKPDKSAKGKGKGAGKNANKGSSKGVGKGGKPAAAPKLSRDGCSFWLSGGSPCCIFYNSPSGCNDKVTVPGKRCGRGFHNCGKVLAGGVCGGEHSMQNCTGV